MSHFTVLVIGDNWEKQLEPYDERIEVEPYFREYGTVPVGAVPQIGKNPSPEKLAAWLTMNFGEKYFVQDGKVGYMSQYNPKSKWDWYVLGGRWTGYFPVKPGAEGKLGESGAFGNSPNPGCADQILLKDVDVERAQNEAEAEGRQFFAKWRQAFEKFEHRPEPFSVIRDRLAGKDDNFDPSKMDLVRNTYNKQPAIREYERIAGFTWGCPVEDMGFYEEVYISNCRNGALVPFALLKDGEWIERSTMGWFGMSFNETMSEEDWCVKFQELLDSLPEDTLLSLVDCHI